MQTFNIFGVSTRYIYSSNRSLLAEDILCNILDEKEKVG